MKYNLHHRAVKTMEKSLHTSEIDSIIYIPLSFDKIMTWVDVHRFRDVYCKAPFDPKNIKMSLSPKGLNYSFGDISMKVPRSLKHIMYETAVICSVKQKRIYIVTTVRQDEVK